MHFRIIINYYLIIFLNKKKKKKKKKNYKLLKFINIYTLKIFINLVLIKTNIINFFIHILKKENNINLFKNDYSRI